MAAAWERNRTGEGAGSTAGTEEVDTAGTAVADTGVDMLEDLLAAQSELVVVRPQEELFGRGEMVAQCSLIVSLGDKCRKCLTWSAYECECLWQQE